jgi:uncharacterized protein (TIRG00374 family)
VTTAAAHAFRALRWQHLLQPIGRVHFSNALRTTLIGFAASALLPARAGEVLRPAFAGEGERLSATAAFATIILERLLDTMMVLVLFAAFLLFFSSGLAEASSADVRPGEARWGDRRRRVGRRPHRDVLLPVIPRRSSA